jgi:hypothetical protein
MEYDRYISDMKVLEITGICCLFRISSEDLVAAYLCKIIVLHGIINNLTGLTYPQGFMPPLASRRAGEGPRNGGSSGGLLTDLRKHKIA